MQTKLLFQSVLCGALLVSSVQDGLAEGSKSFNGAQGVNRVVRSDASGATPRLSTSGTVTINFFHPVNGVGRFDLATNPFNNKPTAYLGAETAATGGRTQQFDAGLQFDTAVRGNWPIGWAAFFSRNNVYIGGHVWNPTTGDHDWRPTSPGWRAVTDTNSGNYIGATGSIDTDMTFTVIPNGSCTIQITAMRTGNNTFFYNPNQLVAATKDFTAKAVAAHQVGPWGSPFKYNTTNQGSATVKRVSGMTRRGSTDQLDGSETSAQWSQCQVNGGSWQGRVAQGVTGYDSPDNSSLQAWDRRVNNLSTQASHTITEFSGAGLTNIKARAEIDQAARYDGETVTVNLGTATALKGQAVQW